MQSPAQRALSVTRCVLAAERIELWVGTEDSWRGGAQNGHSHGVATQVAQAAQEGAEEDKDRDETDSDATPFQYLGFITLSDNQGTGFKSRELKSVSVPPCAGSYLKIRLHRNHSNQYNRYNQVSEIHHSPSPVLIGWS